MSEFNLGFVIFPGITQLDFTGPFEVLSRLGTPPSLAARSEFPDVKTHVVAKSLAPVVSDRGLGFLPTSTFADCPSLDLICVPGGSGVADALGDPELVAFIRTQGLQARYTTSVCTGAFSSWCRWAPEGPPGNDALSLYRFAPTDWRGLREGTRRARRQRVHIGRGDGWD
jgi:transcriptional regulator GlxA family with amidase domain